MGHRIQPNRSGWSGYDVCVGIDTYELDCPCCTVGNPGCVESYYNIPTKLSKSTDNAAWNVDHNTYITEGPAVPDTSRHIWITTEPTVVITPTVCCYTGESDDYDFLETDYIDVPPIRTRGISYPSPATPTVQPPPPPCIRCYDETPSSYPPNSTVSYKNASGTPVEVQGDIDAEGRILPRTLDRADVSEDYFGPDDDCEEVTFIYCSRFAADGVKPETQCTDKEYITVDYREDVGDAAEQFYVGLNISGIPVGDGGSITHVLAKDSSNCLYWIAVTDCPA